MFSKEVILDFTDNGKLNIDDLKYLNSNANYINDKFSFYLNKLKVLNKKKKYFFTLPFFSSNNFGDLYYFICRVEVLKNNIKNNKKIKKIIIDNLYTKKIFLKILKENSIICDIEIIQSKKENIIKKITILFFKIFTDYFASRFYKFDYKMSKNPVLLDSFLSINSIRENYIEDNYFGPYEKYLKDEQLENLIIFPRLIERNTLNIFKLFNILKKLKYHKRKFIIDISLLQLIDFIYCFFNAILISFKKYNFPKYENLDISEFCNKLIIRDSAKLDVLSNFYRIKAIKRLSNKNIQFKTIINWYENQSIDKTSINSFKKFFPNTSIKSYQGLFLFNIYSSMFISDFEYENNLSPDILCCISNKCISKYNAKYKIKNILLSPCYRYSYLFDLKIKNISIKPKKILISLTLLQDEMLNLFFITNELCKDKHDYDITIAFHPRNQSYINRLIDSQLSTISKQKVTISQLSSNKIIQNFDLVITYHSNIAIEASILNIPVAIYANNKGTTMNPLLAGITDSDSFVFYEYSDLKNYINKVFNKKNNKMNTINNVIEKNQLIIPNNQNTKEFFNL